MFYTNEIILICILMFVTNLKKSLFLSHSCAFAHLYLETSWRKAHKALSLLILSQKMNADPKISNDESYGERGTKTGFSFPSTMINCCYYEIAITE